MLATTVCLLGPTTPLCADEKDQALPKITMTIPAEGLGRGLGAPRETGFLAGIPVDIEYVDDLFMIRTPVDRIAEVKSLLDLTKDLADYDFWAQTNRFRFGSTSTTTISFALMDMDPVELAVHIAVSAGMPIAVDPCVFSAASGPTERLKALKGNSFRCSAAALEPVTIAVPSQPWDVALEKVLAESGLVLFRYWRIWLLTTEQRAEMILQMDLFKIAGVFEPVDGGPEELQAAAVKISAALPNSIVIPVTSLGNILIVANGTERGAIERLSSSPGFGFHEITVHGQTDFTGERISLLLDADTLIGFAQTISKLTWLKLQFPPLMNGTVVMNAREVPWDNAVMAAMRLNRVDVELEEDLLRLIPEAPRNSPSAFSMTGCALDPTTIEQLAREVTNGRSHVSIDRSTGSIEFNSEPSDARLLRPILEEFCTLQKAEDD